MLTKIYKIPEKGVHNRFKLIIAILPMPATLYILNTLGFTIKASV